MSSFLTNVNRAKIETRHISGKAKLNPLSDLQSRSPPDCHSEFCSIHKFIEESIDNIIVEGAKNCSVNASTQGFTNKESWKSAQELNQACPLPSNFSPLANRHQKPWAKQQENTGMTFANIAEMHQSPKMAY